MITGITAAALMTSFSTQFAAGVGDGTKYDRQAPPAIIGDMSM